MAQLESPGVSVTVVDESFYTPAAPGTTPLIFVASAQDKQNGAGTGTAPGTLKANAGKVYLLTSQKDLADTFGVPYFETDANNNPVHAGERNEYGLQAAYSYLGVSNRAFVVRADVDTAQLKPSSTAPAGTPEDGTYWLDTANSAYGIFEWNGSPLTVTGGQTFKVKYPTVITAASKIDSVTGGPKASIGAVGDYALLTVTDQGPTNLLTLWYKKGTTSSPVAWVEVGSEEWAASRPAVVSGTVTGAIANFANIAVNGIAVGAASLSGIASEINDSTTLATAGITASVNSVTGKLEIYTTGTAVVIESTSGDPWAPLGVDMGTYAAPALSIDKHTKVPEYKLTDTTPRPTGSVWIKTTTPNAGAHFRVKKYDGATAAWKELTTNVYPTNNAALAGIDAIGGGINIAVGTCFVKTNDGEESPVMGNFKVYVRKAAGATNVKTAEITDQFATYITGEDELDAVLIIQESLAGSVDFDDAVTVTVPFADLTGTQADAETIADAINLADFINVTATVDAGVITISHKLGGEIKITRDQFPDILTGDITVSPKATDPANTYIASKWQPLSLFNTAYEQDATAPVTTTATGQLWYNSDISEVDILVHNGTTWVGYHNSTNPAILDGGAGDNALNPTGPIISATKPKKQTDLSPLANGDLWIDTSDKENFPTIYKYSLALAKWLLVDTGDQSTPDGIVFHDARWNTDGLTGDAATINELLASDFLDPDAPDPALYPKGMLLWNLRRSGFNVKRFEQNYINVLGENDRWHESAAGYLTDQPQSMSSYYPHRWVSEAANQPNGAGTFGRKAQRAVVVQKLQALVNANQQIRDEESRIFNLIACPGYPELVGEMKSLNYDRGLTAFVVADTPARLTPDATSLNNWGTNQAGALEDNDKGLVTSDEYLGFFYPWGYTSDNIGNNIAVPPSHMMLRTIALNDQVAYPWFAPAGVRRGGITNATAVGYITSEGEFQSVALNNGQRDTLQTIKVNPITFITGTGLVNYGQRTRAKAASSLDRINVARLVIYLRRQFAQLAKPYIFEPNDKMTRDEIKQAADSLLLELVGQRAIYDFLVVCDTSNNTPARIDRNELYLDVAIEPVKAVEFIYIPLRLKNTGEIKGVA